MGLVVVGFGLLDMALWYGLLNYLYDHDVQGLGMDLARKAGLTASYWSDALLEEELWNQVKRVEITAIMITFGMGASTQALFARVGGGIYTKAADVGADLYESYCGSILSTAALGAVLPGMGIKAVIAPMLVAALGMLSTLGVTLACDAFGPIADNAGGNAEMAALPSEVRERTDTLDMLGNTTAATGKGFAIGSAALTALALLAAYMEELKLWLGKLASDGEGVFAVGRLAFVDQPGRLESLMTGVSGGRLVEQGSRLLDAEGVMAGCFWAAWRALCSAPFA